MVHENCDFRGWASKNDLRCGDGKIIRHGAFANQDGKKVPLFWNHEHDDVSKVIGHAYLENRNEGVYTYGYLNGTQGGKNAKECLMHGDIESISIWANNLDLDGPNVLHGVIREVSLVPAGANPGAFIESTVSHGQPMGDYDEDAIFYTGEKIELAHSEDNSPKQTEKTEETKKPEASKKEEDMTIQDVVDTMNEMQKKVLYALLAEAKMEKDEGGSKEEESPKKEESEMKHNVFNSDPATEDGETRILSHSDMQKILTDAKRIGSLRDAIQQNIDDGVLVHGVAINKEGMTESSVKQAYGVNDPSFLFPEPHNLNNPPEFISRDMGWVSKVMNGVHRIPFSRIKSQYANITEEEARARGYVKGKQKKEEVFSLLKRTTSPQTIYKLQKMDRDDILDITDFNIVDWIRGEMRIMLNEELARAILIGDGRTGSDDYKIKEDCIRPVVSDVPLFNVTILVKVAEEATEEEIAKATINSIIRSRKQYKGSGRPTFFTTEDTITEMLLLEDEIGHKLYKSDAEIATTLRVNDIVTVEPMENHKVHFSEKDYPLIGTIVNLADYAFGNDKGGDVTAFEDFDIQFNQYRYLIETRRCGALVKPFSAITFLLDKASEAV